jgi:ATP-dependent helicase/nuclease subunit A
MTERVAADQCVRALALAPERSFIVQAPAGSGKTELLTHRFLRLLATVERPEEIVAITFTRKAAGEMRHRILDALQLGSEAESPEELHRQRARTLARGVLERDHALGWALLDNPRRLRIETIDALNAWLARQLPLSSRLGAPPRIADDPEPVYREAVREILLAAGDGDEAGHAPHAAALLAHLGGRFAQAEELLIALLKSRDHWLGKVVGGRAVNPAELRVQFDAALSHFVEDELRRARSSLPADLHAELAELGSGAAARAPGNELLAPLAAATGLPAATAAELPRWRALAGFLLIKTGGWRKSLDKSIGFPAGKYPEKLRMQALLAELAARADAGALECVRALPEPGYGEARWAILEHLLQLLPTCAAALELAFAARGESDYVGVARAALDALGPPDEPTDLALALDCRINHLLVDEFQDTSQSQVELLERLTAGWTPGDGRTLFCVGDPMQSIYRFREADVGRFLRAQQTGIGSLTLEPLRLTVNFRSQGALVDWVSGAFQAIFPSLADLSLGAVPLAPSQPWHPPLPGPAVRCVAVRPGDRLAEAAAVAAIVAGVRREEPGASVAVLVRGRRHLAAITPALKAAGIAFQAVEIEPLAEGPAIRDLEALTRALCHRADRTAWLAVLRAPWCGLRLEDLMAVAGTERDDVWARLRTPAVLDSLSDAGRERVTRLVAVCDAALAERGRRSLRRVVAGAWLALGGPATLEHASELDDARRFIEFLDGRARHGDLDDPAALAGLLGDLYAAPDPSAGDSVQLLTIHKAKGLEFDHVVLPGLDRTVAGEGKRLLRWLEQVRERGTELILAPVEALGEDRDELHRALRELERRRDALEQDRVLYVAATRACCRLHLVAGIGPDHPETGAPPRPPSGSPLARLWPALGDAFLAAREAIVPAEAAPRERPAALLRRLATGWRAPPLLPAVSWARGAAEPSVPDAAVEYDWVGREARAIGIAVHRLLQVMAREGPEAWQGSGMQRAAPQISALLSEAGLDARAHAAAVDNCLAALARTLDDARGRWLLDPRHGEATSERRVTGRIDGRLIEAVVDRSFIDHEGTLWIVDFKSGRHEGGDLEAFLDREQERYRPQLERYAHLLGARHRGPVRLGLYFPQHAAWRAWQLPSR